MTKVSLSTHKGGRGRKPEEGEVPQRTEREKGHWRRGKGGVKSREVFWKQTLVEVVCDGGREGK
jgi:hypothetical protein